MYQHGKRTKQPRGAAVFLATLGIIGVVVLVAWYIVHKDIAGSSGPKTQVPIITEIGEDKKDVIQINEPLFTFELPADWKQTNRVQSQAANFYEWRSTKAGADDRRLLLHIDTMPQSYKIVRMQPITPNGGKFILGNLSDECINFAKDAGNEQRAQGNAPVEAKWENVSFMCDPINANQTIGTGTVEGGIAAKLGSHNYFFYFEDHNIHPDSKILSDALKSFVAR